MFWGIYYQVFLNVTQTFAVITKNALMNSEFHCYVMMDISSRSRLSATVFTTFPRYLVKDCLRSSGSSSRLE